MLFENPKNKQHNPRLCYSMLLIGRAGACYPFLELFGCLGRLGRQTAVQHGGMHAGRQISGQVSRQVYRQASKAGK